MLRKLTMIVVTGLLLASCGGGGSSTGSSSASSSSSSSLSSSSSSSSVSVAGADWTTYQGSATHTGYVSGSFTPASFTKIWSWSRPDKGVTTNGINEIATGGGRVFMTTDDYQGEGFLYGVDQMTGAVAWKYDFGGTRNVGEPAYASGVVYVLATAGSPSLVTLYAINATSGAVVWKSAAIANAATNLSTPVVDGNLVYIDIGQTVSGAAATVHAYSTTDGSLKWTGPLTNTQYVTGGQSPAIDSGALYNYTGRALEKLDKATGALMVTKPDQLNTSLPGPYFASLAVESNGNVVGYLGTRDVTNYSSQQQDASHETREIQSWLLGTGTPSLAGWVDGTQPYSVIPAVAGGIVFEPYNVYDYTHIFTTGVSIIPGGIMARDASNDQLLWTWYEGSLNDLMVNNTIVTDNLVFVSSTTTTYAIDLTTHSTVWTYPAGGLLALGNNVLFINTGGTTSDGGVVAIRLK